MAPAWLTRRPIAHRGLHDDNRAVAENSIPAARAAIARDYAIECDVVLSADRVPMIFHDERLDRLTAASGPVGARTAAELAAIPLRAGGAAIPTVAAFLAAVDGAVPIVMELKGREPAADADMLDRLAPILEAYRGDLALMSFDAWLIEAALARGTQAVGLTAEGTDGPELARHEAVFAKGCSFVSYNVRHLPNPFVSRVRAAGAPVITWTVRTPQAAALSEAEADGMTFEGFLP